MRITIVTKKNSAKIVANLKKRSLDLSAYRKMIRPIIKKVLLQGDKALFDFTKKYDQVSLKSLKVGENEIKMGLKQTPTELLKAIKLAKNNITKFQREKFTAPKKMEVSPGVTCWRVVRPLDSVGLYVPGGNAPLISTLLMLAIPARLAGVKRIVLCSPPQKTGKLSPAILAACSLLGLNEVYSLGGAQAIAALAYGTETIAKVDKIVGPGNSFVTAAKAEISIDPAGSAIDMLAGPSELAIIADRFADPIFIAADLLAQAEHDALAEVILFSDSLKLVKKVNAELAIQLKSLPRKKIAQKALVGFRMFLVPNLTAAVSLSNAYAPEHLSIQVKQPKKIFSQVENAGSVFLGSFSPEAVGDYTSGTNHSLPTLGKARIQGGVSMQTFLKTFTVQELNRQGLKNLSAETAVLARAEGLEGHARSVEKRLKKY